MQHKAPINNRSQKAIRAHAHDKIFRRIMANLNIAQNLLKMHLPADILEAVELETLVPCKEIFVSSNLSLTAVDLLYQVKLKDSEDYLHILVEHFSKYAQTMFFRLDKYSVEIKDSYVHTCSNWELLLVNQITDAALQQVTGNAVIITNANLAYFVMQGELERSENGVITATKLVKRGKLPRTNSKTPIKQSKTAEIKKLINQLVAQAELPELKKHRLPMVLTMLYYHGTTKLAGKSASDEYPDHWLNERLLADNKIIVDLSDVLDRELAENPLSGFLQWAQKNIWCADFNEKLPELTSFIIHINNKYGKDYNGEVTTIIKYIMHKGNISDKIKFLDEVNKHIGDSGAENMSTAVQQFYDDGVNDGIILGRKEGIEKGIEKGGHQTRVGMVVRMLQNGMKVSDIMKIAEISEAEVKQLQIEAVTT